MVKFEAFKNQHFHTRERVFLIICAQFFLLLCMINKLALLPGREGECNILNVIYRVLGFNKDAEAGTVVQTRENLLFFGTVDAVSTLLEIA